MSVEARLPGERLERGRVPSPVRLDDRVRRPLGPLLRQRCGREQNPAERQYSTTTVNRVLPLARVANSVWERRFSVAP